ncbi:hypothetical protein nbrc107696_28730 [Gordonia spumicola]|uniref:Uncharacterized protein n=1 Tax=Gordonia spumicola TaxID=589161 RepID=A0A7I9VAQ4_9ACTN|nr:MspA family porin [Gordonia spumicola]GEE02427.1 hypothetical protein nbrc107696_28730 [Gordonia spumicola]
MIADTGEVGPAAASTYKDKTITRTSDGGWKVSLTKSSEQIQSVPALSRGLGSYEAFLDLRGSATITDAGSAPVDAAVLSTGFQVSCQWQMDGVNVGIAGGPTAQMSISYPPAIAPVPDYFNERAAEFVWGEFLGNGVTALAY